jgi:regulator of sigma E protease
MSVTVLATVIVLGVLIFVHELGHFLAARSVGIRVERFSIGFGPRLFGFVRNGTEFVVSAIPLGGFVKMGGMDDEVMAAIEGKKGPEEKAAAKAADVVEGVARRAAEGSVLDSEPDDSTSPVGRHSSDGDFDAKPVWARSWVISAGVIMNMLFAFVTYVVVAALWGSPELDTTRIGSVRADLLPAGAEPLGSIPPGATITAVGDREVGHWGELREAVLGSPEGEVVVAFRGPSADDPVGEVTVRMGDRATRELAFRTFEVWSEPVVDVVIPGRPADRAGIRSGDRVLAVDGVEIGTWSRFVSVVQGSAGVELEITLQRDGGTVVRSVVPEEEVVADPVTGVVRPIGQIGIVPILPGVTYTRVPPGDAIAAGFAETRYVTGEILGFLRDLVTGRVSARSLGSIVSIGEASGQAAAEGLPVFLRFMALFSVNLAVLNLLPIPVLDGGHLLFLGIEATRGRPLSVQQRLRWSQVGFVVLMGIMVLALGNDFLRLFGL